MVVTTNVSATNGEVVTITSSVSKHDHLGIQDTLDKYSDIGIDLSSGLKPERVEEEDFDLFSLFSGTVFAIHSYRPSHETTRL